MKKINEFLFLSAFVLMFCAAVFPQREKNLDKYKLRTLAEIPLINREATDEILRKSRLGEQHDFISYDLLYSRVRVNFAGQQRSVSQSHRELIKIWGNLQNIGRKITSLYENEFLFQEGDKQFWIPLPKQVEKALVTEIKTNDTMTLYVIHVGGRKAAMASEYEWLFLSTAFEK